MDECAPWVRAKHRLDLSVFDRPKTASPSIVTLLSAVVCPTLLLHGDVGLGSVLDPELIGRCQDQVGGRLEVTHVVGAGHNVRRDRRSAYLTTVQRWRSRRAPPT